MTKKILIVEDTKDALDNLKDLLGLEGFEISTAVNGQDALHKLYLYMPDLIITDLRMPKMDGFAFIETLKQSEEFKSIPVVVFSANATPENEKKSLEMGAIKFLKKPSAIELILSTIHEALSLGTIAG
ncbi:MAG TPA: response regulator [Flavobacterium sp.]|nr:response regulator [Flavobacterium sp.]